MKMLMAATLGATLLALPVPAHAVDHRPCVSRIEYNGMVGRYLNGERPSRDEVEGRWDVSTIRMRHIDLMGQSHVYKRCGYNDHEAWVAAAFYSDGRLKGLAKFIRTGATISGYP